MNIGTAHGTFASRSILGDIFSDLGVFQQPVNAWIVRAALENKVREVLRDVFGTDGSAPANMYTMIVTAIDDIDKYHGPVTCCGKVLARASGRDSGAKVGDDVALIDGSITSGGSSKNWRSIVKKDSVFKLLNVFPGQKDHFDPFLFKVEVTAESEDMNDTLTSPLRQFSDEEIIAEARRRGLVDDSTTKPDIVYADTGSADAVW